MTITCPLNDHCEKDTAVQLLRYIFDERFINSFIFEDSPSPVLIRLGEGADASLMAQVVSETGQIALACALVVLIISWFFNFFSSVNDGEIKGVSRGQSSGGYFARPLFSVIMLFPTFSGYSIVAVILMWVVLMSNGVANTAYMKFSQASVSPASLIGQNITNNISAKNIMVDPLFYGAIHGYCVNSVAANVYSPEMSQSAFFRLKSEGLKRETIGTNAKLSFSIEDTGANGTLGSSGVLGPLCGTGKIEYDVYRQDATASLSGMDLASNSPLVAIALQEEEGSNLPRRIAADLSALRVATNLFMYQQGYRYSAGGLPIHNRIISDLDKYIGEIESGISDSDLRAAFTNIKSQAGSLPSSGWVVLQSGQDGSQLEPQYDANLMVDYSLNVTKLLDKAMIDYLTKRSIVGTKAKADQEALKAFEKETYAIGWMGAGFSRARLASARKSIINTLYSGRADFALAPRQPTDEDRGSGLNTHLNGLTGVMKNLQRDLETQRYKIAGVAKTDSTLSFANEYIYGDNATSNDAAGNAALEKYFSVSRTSFGITSLENWAVSYLLGTPKRSSDGTLDLSGANGDMLARVQDVGESFAIASTVANTSKMTLVIAKGSTDGASNTPIVGAFAGAGSGLLTVAITALDFVINVMGSVATMLGTVVPALPYVLLAVASIGWFLQILMTIIAIQLFMIMHALPSNGFIGSQQQGWVAILVLFLRPLLIVTGFFVAFLIYEPLIMYLTAGFFQFRQNTGLYSSDVGAFMSELSTVRDFWYMYGAVMIAATYLIFGIVQEFGDEISGWMGTNLLRGFGNINSERLMVGLAGAALASRTKFGQMATQYAGSLSRSLQGGQQGKPGGNDPNTPSGPNGGLGPNGLPLTDRDINSGNTPYGDKQVNLADEVATGQEGPTQDAVDVGVPQATYQGDGVLLRNEDVGGAVSAGEANSNTEELSADDVELPEESMNENIDESSASSTTGDIPTQQLGEYHKSNTDDMGKSEGLASENSVSDEKIDGIDASKPPVESESATKGVGGGDQESFSQSGNALRKAAGVLATSGAAVALSRASKNTTLNGLGQKTPNASGSNDVGADVSSRDGNKALFAALSIKDGSAKVKEPTNSTGSTSLDSVNVGGSVPNDTLSTTSDGRSVGSASSLPTENANGVGLNPQPTNSTGSTSLDSVNVGGSVPNDTLSTTSDGRSVGSASSLPTENANGVGLNPQPTNSTGSTSLNAGDFRPSGATNYQESELEGGALLQQYNQQVSFQMPDGKTVNSSADVSVVTGSDGSQVATATIPNINGTAFTQTTVTTADGNSVVTTSGRSSNGVSFVAEQSYAPNGQLSKSTETAVSGNYEQSVSRNYSSEGMSYSAKTTERVSGVAIVSEADINSRGIVTNRSEYSIGTKGQIVASKKEQLSAGNQVVSQLTKMGFSDKPVMRGGNLGDISNDSVLAKSGVYTNVNFSEQSQLLATVQDRNSIAKSLRQKESAESSTVVYEKSNNRFDQNDKN